jgi:hypothetical protein
MVVVGDGTVVDEVPGALVVGWAVGDGDSGSVWVGEGSVGLGAAALEAA